MRVKFATEALVKEFWKKKAVAVAIFVHLVHTV
jgi:hypothetical protein